MSAKSRCPHDNGWLEVPKSSHGVPNPVRVREGGTLAKRFWDFAKALHP